MRSRLIAVLAALLMLAPAVGFAGTMPARTDHVVLTSSKPKTKKKKRKMRRKNKKMKHSKKKMKKGKK